MKRLTKARLKSELFILKQDIKDLRQAEKIWEGLLLSWPDDTDYIFVDEEGAVEKNYWSTTLMTLMLNALEKQTGGNHYKDMAIQPAEYAEKNGLSLLEGNIVKYVSRWKKKGQPLSDLNKIIHCAELIKEIHNVSEDK